MRYILIVFTVVASFFTFQVALEKYDSYISEKFIEVNPGEHYFEISVSGNLSAGETLEFHNDLMRLLDEHSLYCYQRYYVDSEMPEYIVWAYTDDPYYFGNVLLTKGKLTSIDPGDYYYSNDGALKGLIYNPIRNKNYKLYHLDNFSNEHKSVFIPYIIITYAEGAESVYQTMADNLRELYPHLYVDAAMFHVHGRMELGSGGGTLTSNDIVFAALAGMIVVVCLNIIIVSQTKKIQILKLEGYGNWHIYRRYVLRYAGYVLTAAFAINIFLYLLYIETSLGNAMPFVLMLVIPNVIFIASILTFSILLLRLEMISTSTKLCLEMNI